MNSPLQQFYEIKINGVDVSEDVLGSVVYEENEELLTTLEFSLAKGSMYLETLKIGNSVTLYGGTQDIDNQKLFFKGVIKRIRSTFPDSGMVVCRLICYAGAWGKTTRSDEVHMYPGKDSKRFWANVPTLKASDIIRNLALEFQMESSIDIVADVTYTLINPLKQSYETDWSLLQRMAKSLNCVAWAELIDGKEVLHFIDKDKTRHKDGKLEFVYLERDSEGYFKIKELGKNQLQLRGLSIDEDSDAAEGNVRVVTMFDKETGEEKTIMQEHLADKEETFYWELDEAKVHAADEATQDKLFSLGAAGIPFEIAKQYYKKISVDDLGGGGNMFGVQGRPYIGIQATATVDGDIRILAHQSFRVSGVSKYSSPPGKATWYLVSCKHIWGDTGYECELNFLR